MSVGTAFHPRTEPLNRKMQWREWSGYFARQRLRRLPRHRVQRDPRGGRADRRQPALQVRGRGPRRAPAGRPGDHPGRDEARRTARSTTRRGATRTARSSTTGRSIGSAEDRVPLDGGRPAVPLADDERDRARRHDRGRSASRSPRSPSRARGAGRSSRRRPGESFGDLRYFRRRAAAVGGIADRREPDRLHRRPRLRAVGRRPSAPSTLWDALMAAGRAYGIRPAGMLALDVVRARGRADPARGRLHERPPRHERRSRRTRRTRSGSAGWSTSTRREFVGKRALAAEQRRAADRLGGSSGSSSSWDDIVRPVRRPGPAAGRPGRSVSRGHAPLFDAGGGRQIGRVTSLGWSPILKKPIALASVPASHEPAGSRLSVEWTVEARRGRVGATVVGAALPRPAAQARLVPSPVEGGPDARLRRVRPLRGRAPAGLDGRAGRVLHVPIGAGRPRGAARRRRLDRRPAAPARGERRCRRAAGPARGPAARRRRHR